MKNPVYEPYESIFSFNDEEMIARARSYRDDLKTRRTVRDYDSAPIPVEVITACLEAAATAPNGANKQPWHFVVVMDPSVKSQIRASAEKEEQAFYRGRASSEWLEALRAIGTDEHKPFLEDAPVLIAIFAQSVDAKEDGTRSKNYYVQESVGIATGMLISALHLSGLSTLTHTPSPMGFLNEILNRPKHERAFLLLVVGHPAKDAKVPVIRKKNTSEFISYV